MSIDNMAIIIATYKENAELLAALEAEQEEIRAQLKEELTSRNLDRLDINGHKVAMGTYSRTTLDSKAVKVAAPQIYEAFSKTSSYTRITIA